MLRPLPTGGRDLKKRSFKIFRPMKQSDLHAVVSRYPWPYIAVTKRMPPILWVRHQKKDLHCQVDCPYGPFVTLSHKKNRDRMLIGIRLLMWVVWPVLAISHEKVICKRSIK